MAYSTEIQNYLHFVRLCEVITENKDIYNPLTSKKIKLGSRMFIKLTNDGIIENYNYKYNYLKCLNYNIFKETFIKDDIINRDITDREAFLKDYLESFNINTYNDALEILEQQKYNLLNKIENTPQTGGFNIGSGVKIEHILINPFSGLTWYNTKKRRNTTK